MPTHTDDPGQNHALSYAYGYIQALIQVMKNEG
jgi:hypothetical protein